MRLLSERMRKAENNWKFLEAFMVPWKGQISKWADEVSKLEKSDCVWRYNEWHDVWATSCGNLFCIENGKPSDNEMSYCCYCGGKLIEYSTGDWDK